MSSSKKKSRAPQPQKQKAVSEPPTNVGIAPVLEEKTGTGTTIAVKRPLFKPSSTILIMAGVLVLALAVRLLPLLYCIKDGRVMFYEFDPYYHMRMIMYSVAHFPSTSIFDSYVDYPNGYFIGWPPLFDLTAAAASLVVGLGHPDQFTVEIVSSAMPVILGLLGIVATFYLVRDAMGEKAALIASLVMAILPATVARTIFGYVDHHVLEILLSVTMYLLFLRSVTRGKAQGLSIKSIKAGKEPVIYAALAGFAIGAAVFAWDGAPIFISLLLLYAFVQYVYDAYRGESSEYLTIAGFTASLVALVIVAPFAATGYHGQHMEISAIYISWFHIIMLASSAVIFLAMGLLSSGLRKKAPWYAFPAIVIVAGGLLTVAAKVALPQMFANLEAGISFLMGSSEVLASISEVRPLFINAGEFSLWTAWIFLTTAVLIAVPGFILYILAVRKRKFASTEIFLILWTIIITAMALMQARFVYLLGINIAIFTGYGAYSALKAAGLDRFVETARGKKDDKKHSRHLHMPWALATVAAIITLLLVPSVYYSYALAAEPMSQTFDWNDAAQWIKQNTPQTSNVYSAGIGTSPEYSVMTWWDYGNYILYEAERPAVANNFQTGISDAANFFIAQNESAADAIMDKRNARYVVVDFRMGPLNAGIPGGIFENMPDLAGDNASSYFMSYRMLDPSVSGTMAFTDGNDKYYSTIYSRMFNDHGCGGRDKLGNITSGLQHYRMIYANSGTDPTIVFEKVPGAIIKGKAVPGANVKLSLNLSIGQSNLTYYSYATADQAGDYQFTVPYKTDDTSSPVKTAPSYTITAGNSMTEVQVSADAVTGGETMSAGGLR